MHNSILSTDAVQFDRPPPPEDVIHLTEDVIHFFIRRCGTEDVIHLIFRRFSPRRISIAVLRCINLQDQVWTLIILSSGPNHLYGQILL